MWYRIFGGSSAMPAPEIIRKLVVELDASSTSSFTNDTTGWYQADLHVAGVSLQLERYCADEPGMRGELNGWAAWLETREEAPERDRLMERMIQTAQLFTLKCGEKTVESEQACVALCRFLAERTAGVYQIDGRGFFAADGHLLLAE
jgi:hypothetical protein